MDLTQKIKEMALELGFSRVGITGVEILNEQLQALEERKENYTFLAEGLKLVDGCDPKKIMPEAKSIISLAYDFSYFDYPQKMLIGMGRAYLARAYNPRKNSIHWLRLQRFKDYLTENNVKYAESRITISDRLVAAKAGVATFGKNNFAFMNGGSSFVQLYSLVVDADLQKDNSTAELRCPPDCHKCIESCPTKALFAAGKLDPTKCISFYNCFTQDGMHRTTSSHIPYDVRPVLGAKIHGCDICQEVCPRNQGALKKANVKDSFIEKIAPEFELEKILLMDDEYYERIMRPISYNYIRDRKYLQRNAAIAMGNSHDPKYIPFLLLALEHKEPLIREYAAWALHEIDPNQAFFIFKLKQATEIDGKVLAEMKRLTDKVNQ